MEDNSENEVVDNAEHSLFQKEYVGCNGKVWKTTVEEHHGRRGRENIVRERMEPTINPATVNKAIDLVFTVEMKGAALISEEQHLPLQDALSRTRNPCHLCHT